MLERFNVALEQSLSIRSIRWRIEARRTHRPFAEVVLLHTLVYRVEQVFLIDPATGLVEHVTADFVQARDADQVSSMLEAIDAFVREALGPQPAGVHLSRIKLGDVTVWVERDGFAAVAAIVQGTAPPDLGETLREVRERIVLTHRNELMRFQSDVAPFATVRTILEECFLCQRRSPPRRGPMILGVAAAIGLAVAGGVFGTERARAQNEARLLAAYTETLGKLPGIIVGAVKPAGDRVHIQGLRDPAAEDPAEVLARRGLPPAELQFQPFLSTQRSSKRARDMCFVRRKV